MAKRSVRRGGPRLRSAWLALAVCLGVTVVLRSAGTAAFWRDRATASGGTFGSGTLDVLLGGALAGQGGTWTNPQLQLSAMRPGESLAVDFEMRNGGTVPLLYRATAVANGPLATYLRFTVATGATAANQVDGLGNRTGSCQGGTTRFTDGTLGGAPTSVIGTDQTLGPGQTQIICVRVRLDPAAPTTAQGQSAGSSFDVTARQQGAPP